MAALIRRVEEYAVEMAWMPLDDIKKHTCAFRLIFVGAMGNPHVILEGPTTNRES